MDSVLRAVLEPRPIVPAMDAFTIVRTFMFFATLLRPGKGQDRVVYPTESVELVASNLERGYYTFDGIPERILLLMRDVNNVTEFMTQFVVPEDAPRPPPPPPDVNERPSFLSPKGEMAFVNAKKTQRTRASGELACLFEHRRRALAAAAAGLDVAQFAVCRPELQVVKLQKPVTSGVMLWPPCVRLRRCGGCCTSKLLACRPIAVSTVNITVLQVRISPQRLDSFESEGQRTLTVEQHDRCACGCKQLPEQCVPGVQEYRPAECRCVCINQEMALQCVGPDRFWDSADCACKCRHPAECSTGFYFNFRSCRCEAFRDALLGLRPPPPTVGFERPDYMARVSRNRTEN